MEIEREEIQWLPDFEEQITLTQSDYIERLYEIFHDNFIKNKVFYKNLLVKINEITYSEMEISFWKTVAKELDNGRFQLEEERCKRVRWPKAIMENHEKDTINNTKIIRIWRAIASKNRIREKILLSFFNVKEHDYLIVFGVDKYKKKKYNYITSYPVEQPNRKRRLIKEYCENAN